MAEVATAPTASWIDDADLEQFIEASRAWVDHVEHFAQKYPGLSSRIETLTTSAQAQLILDEFPALIGRIQAASCVLGYTDEVASE